MGFNHGVPPQKVDAVPVYEYQVGYIICMIPAYIIYTVSGYEYDK